MSIITISRGSYSRGKEVAEKLAAALEYECISRDILLEASTEFNIPEIKLVRALHDAPSVLERFTHGKERYLCYLRSALLNRVVSDDVVYHGLAGHYFLQTVPHVLKVRILADMEDRVREEMARENIPEEEARSVLKKDDEERRKWGVQVYGVDTWDPSLYDIVLHIGRITVDDAVDLLRAAVRRPAFQRTAASQKILNDLALAARVLGNLITLAPRIDVRADDGVVVVTTAGVVTAHAAEEIQRLAGAVEGVQDVRVNAPSEKPQGDHINPFHNIG
jgi:cytidylate kinase